MKRGTGAHIAQLVVEESSVHPILQSALGGQRCKNRFGSVSVQRQPAPREAFLHSFVRFKSEKVWWHRSTHRTVGSVVVCVGGRVVVVLEVVGVVVEVVRWFWWW